MFRGALTAVPLGLLLAALCASPAAAGGLKEPCDGDVQRVGDLGIAALDCDCTYSGRSASTDGRVVRVRRWTFRSEPQVGGIRAGGPAAGKLREGDVITAIDGVLITTREGARRFVNVVPGTPAVLTVRREGREIPVRIVADAVCPEQALAPAVFKGWSGFPTQDAADFPRMPEFTPETPDPAVAPEATQAPEGPQAPEAPQRVPKTARPPKPAIQADEALPRGWLGAGITCRNCSWRPGDEGEPPMLEFGMLPTIYKVDSGSPAARAGLQIGDVLTELDGISLLTEEGGRRFGALVPGQSVRLTVRRGGRVRTATVVAGVRPEREIPLTELGEKLKELSENHDAQRMSMEMRRLAREMERAGLTVTRQARERLRYAGAVGGSEVEVRGMENVMVDDTGDEIVITTRDATIRIRKAEASAPRAAEKGKEKKK